MGKEAMMLLLGTLLVPLAGKAQEVNREKKVDILPADDDSTHFSDPTIREDFEQWLNQMPTTIAKNPDDILQPVEPDFLSIVAPKDKPNLPQIDYEGLMKESETAKTNFQLAKQGEFLQRQKQEQAGGAMTIGVTVGIPLGKILKKLFPSKKRKRREELQKILDEY